MYSLKKEAEELGQQSQNLGCENRRLEHIVEILKNLKNVCRCFLQYKQRENTSSYLSDSK